MGATEDFALPYPEPDDPNDTPTAIKTLAARVAVVLRDLFVRTDDARLGNARNPTGPAGGVLDGAYPNPSIRNGTLSSTGPFASALLDGTAASPTLRSLGTGPRQAAAGNHAHYGGDTDWVNLPIFEWSGAGRYLRKSGWVCLELDTTRAAFNVGDGIGRLPEGFRPSQLVRGAGDFNGSPRYFSVNPDGVVSAAGNSSTNTGGIYGSVAFPVTGS